MNPYLIEELTIHLINSHMTFSTEDMQPPTLRPVKVEALLECLLNYMIGEGYVRTEIH